MINEQLLHEQNLQETRIKRVYADAILSSLFVLAVTIIIEGLLSEGPTHYPA